MSKSLVELANEYDTSIAAMLECVEKIKKEKRKAYLAGDSDSYKQLSSKLLTVYEEIRDMRIIAEHLKHYYDESERKEICA